MPGRLVSIRWRGIGALGHARQGVFLTYREQDRGACSGQLSSGRDSGLRGQQPGARVICQSAAGHIKEQSAS